MFSPLLYQKRVSPVKRFSADNQQLFPRARDGGVEPAVSLAAERPRFVEHDDEIEFGALRLMAGDGIGKFETADGFFRHRFQLMQKREIVFMDDRPSASFTALSP